MMHKVFGVKKDDAYFDREGAYLIPVCGGNVGVIRTLKGYFLIGGGLTAGETHVECIKRECMEETGYSVTVGNKVCSAESYCIHEKIGFFHPVQTYYAGKLLSKEAAPTEKDHVFQWAAYEEIRGKLYSEMQNWALDIIMNLSPQI